MFPQDPLPEITSKQFPLFYKRVYTTVIRKIAKVNLLHLANKFNLISFNVPDYKYLHFVQEVKSQVTDSIPMQKETTT